MSRSIQSASLLASGLLLGSLLLNTEVSFAEMTAEAKRLEAEIQERLVTTEDRRTRAEWETLMGRTFGQDHSALRTSRTHMPRGVGFAVSVKSPAGALSARRTASEYARKNAESALQRATGRQPTSDQTNRYILSQSARIRDINKHLARVQQQQMTLRGTMAEQESVKQEYLQQVLDITAGTALSQSPHGISERDQVTLLSDWLKRGQML